MARLYTTHADGADSSIVECFNCLSRDHFRSNESRVQFVFAEKLETTIFRGADNSRMKDFHDLYTLASSGKMLNEKDAAIAIRLVFEHRKTPIRLPMQFDVSALEALQQYWGRYRPSAVLAKVLPKQIEEIIAVINKLVDKIM